MVGGAATGAESALLLLTLDLLQFCTFIDTIKLVIAEKAIMFSSVFVCLSLTGLLKNYQLNLYEML